MIEATPETRAYWDALAAGTLTAERCVGCGTIQPYPKRYCENCGGQDRERLDVGESATVYSFTVVHRAQPSFYLQPPFAIGLLDTTAEGHRILAPISGDLEVLAIGKRVWLTPLKIGEMWVPHYTTTESVPNKQTSSARPQRRTS